MAQSLFEKFMFEAPGEDPTNEVPDDTTDNTPDDPEPVDDSNESDPPVDEGYDAPPDIGDMDGSYDDLDDESNIDNDNNLGIDEKISAILNMNLYQSYLNLLTEITTQLNSIRDNSDILYTLFDEMDETLNSLNKLDENIRLYIKNSFLNNRYERNQFFYNKCLNLYKLLNDKFNDSVHKGIKDI